MNFYARRCQSRYEQWILDPIRTCEGSLLDSRYEYIDIVSDHLEEFLKVYGYTFGRHIDIFRRKLAYFWFFLETAYWKNKYVLYDKPLHRDHEYDYVKFCHVISTDVFLEFTSNAAAEGFCDDSEFGDHIRAELHSFVYHYIDLDKSPAHEDVHERLHQEEEDRKLQEDMKKNPHKYIGFHGNGVKYDYDVSELGYFRGDRIMT